MVQKKGDKDYGFNSSMPNEMESHGYLAVYDNKIRMCAFYIRLTEVYTYESMTFKEITFFQNVWQKWRVYENWKHKKIKND